MAQQDSGKSVLVTGAAGFIGNVVAKRLAQSGRRVFGTDIAMPQGHSPDDFVFVQADARDLARHTAIVAAGCDGIIHCGGISGPMLAGDNPAELFDINIRATTQLLELTRIFGLRRFLGCSSVSAYGNRDDDAAIEEAAALRASSVYGSSKAAMDLVIQTYAARLGVSAAALRIGWVYGPMRRTDGVLRPMIRSGLGGPAFAMPQGADQRLQFVHVDDVASAMIAAYDAPALARPAYNVNGAETMPLRDIAALVSELLPGTRVELGAGPMQDTDRQGDMSLAAMAADFGWRPRVSVREGLERYIAWLRDHEF